MSELKKVVQLANVFHGLSAETDPYPDFVGWLAEALEEFTSEELADLVLKCPPTTSPQPCSEIAKSVGMTPEQLLPMLEEGLEVGLLDVIHSKTDPNVLVYSRTGLFPGLAENIMVKNPTKKGAFWYTNFAETYMTPGMQLQSPLGHGAFRVIPAKTSIKNESKIASYEDVAGYIEKAHLYSISNCACRTAAHMNGNGCEHRYQDTCMQFDDAAESYIMTGRARQISKQEAYDILEQTTKEGFVHQAQVSEEGKTWMLCSCCGCSCIMLRTANLLNYAEPNQSNYVSEVDPEKCVGCGACVENCSTNALTLGTCLAKDSLPTSTRPDPAETEWTEEYWNKDFLVRKMVNEQGTSPCKTFCPAHIAVQGYIRKAGEGKYGEALKVIKRENPFPTVCGRICPHNCENECTRGSLDEAIAIDDIKKFIADKEIDQGFRYVPKIEEHHNFRVAVIGGGPAGLSCAYYLASYGFVVTVFEKEKVVGGMLTLGIPSFRLEKEVIQAEIEVLKELGVKFQTGVEIGKDVTIQELRERGFSAFYLAIGAQNGRKLNVEGEDAEGVISGVEFLKSVNLDPETSSLAGKTVVVGGGNVAIDVARTAVRVGSEETALFCLEQREEMPALPEEQEEATEEGVQIHNGWGPRRILTENGRVTGVEFMRCVRVFDENGRFAPAYDENDLMTVACDTVISSIGQAIEWGGLRTGSQIQVTPRNTVRVVDEISLQTDEKDIFAGGDVLTGPKFAIDAIATGKAGAISIRRYLLGKNLTIRREREYHPLDKTNLDLAGFDRLPRQRSPKVDARSAKNTLKDMRTNLTEEQIRKETARCLGCGITVVDPQKCVGCGVCTAKCEFDAIQLVRRYDIDVPKSEADYMQIIMKYGAERAERIARKKVQKEQVTV